MNRRACLLLLAMIALLAQRNNVYAKQKHTDTLHAAALKPYGRYRLTEAGQLELISSAVHVGVTFRGTQCVVYAAAQGAGAHNYMQYELDGVYQKRIRVNGNRDTAIVITAATPGMHALWIYKATEAHTGPVFITKVAGRGIKPATVAKAPLIEFIGNSITCGAAADASTVACGAGEYHDQHNAYMAYGPRVARLLGANYIVSSVSGIGIYRTWNREGPSMPQVYEHIDFQQGSTQQWDFKKYSPVIVSIALGTNDLSNGDGKTERKPFEEQVFIDHYVSFVKLVKLKYPRAQIALLSSPMVKGTSREVLEKCLTSIKAQVDQAYPKDKPVQLFFFPPMEARGCTGHPSVEDHGVLAGQLQPFFRQLLP